VETVRPSTVAVIGAGASGVLTAAQLLRQAGGGTGPLGVALVGPTPEPGRGAAYGTTHPTHLLNVRVERMSAFPDDPDHLFRWGEARGLPLRVGDFIPRRLYGAYLEDVLHEAAGAARGAALVRLTGSVTAIEDDPSGRGWCCGSATAPRCARTPRCSRSATRRRGRSRRWARPCRRIPGTSPTRGAPTSRSGWPRGCRSPASAPGSPRSTSP